MRLSPISVNGFSGQRSSNSGASGEKPHPWLDANACRSWFVDWTRFASWVSTTTGDYLDIA
jgi:hypothetical protein